MPWVRAVLKGQKVFARADEGGRLRAPGGRVEIRYKPNDGRKYEARAQSLEILDATPLPDETCGAAEPVKRPVPPPKPPPVTVPVSLLKPPPSSRRPETEADAPPGLAPVIAYADGACSGNPGPAGLGVVVLEGEERVEISEYLGVGTNNIAELTAIQRALEEVSDPARALVVHTDSQYAIGVLQKGWKAKANTSLIEGLRKIIATRRSFRLVYVPGHAGVPLNERADALAREAVKERKTRRAALPRRREAE